MTDRPILFSAPMVRALLEGRKTQTRRILKPQPETFEIGEGIPCKVGCMQVEGDTNNRVWLGSENAGVLTSQRIHYAIGDRLWVREAWAKVGDTDDDIHACPDLRIHAYYRADQVDPERQRWRSPIHMPRWASRLTLPVTEIRVQRLQDISEADAIAEGIHMFDDGWHWQRNPEPAYMRLVGIDPVKMYSVLWDYINGPGAWETNPWIVALTLEVEHRNIDAGGAA